MALRYPWAVPYGSFSVELDALSAFFLLPILILSPLAALYGSQYLGQWRGHKSAGAPWFFFNILVASMVLVTTARNGVLFLLAWEIMSLSSFFLVVFEDEREDVRRAGWIYLVATHLGTAFLLVLFVLLGRGSEVLDFAHFKDPSSSPALASLVFALAVVGFGAKAGFVPFHVWLPEAHPAAPSHVSAVMSGVMIKSGVYGLVRVLTFLGPPPAWWGWLLIGIGLSSGILGVLFALAQHDLKRLLAYHSVENIGIIVLGLGLGLLGLNAGLPLLAVLGFAGALFHVLNHALFKGLLFMGAGALLQATGTRELDQLGGLLKRMPWTGAAFLLGAAAISGLPPLNGFASEFLIYLGAFHGHASLSGLAVFPPMGIIAGLALIGGLAAACFAKAAGVVFLGEPRTEKAAGAREVGWLMRLPMLLLALSCALAGLCSPAIVLGLAPALGLATGLDPASVGLSLQQAYASLAGVSLAGLFFLAALALLLALHRLLLARRPVTWATTWDCGYALPSSRMQYTASSFAWPLTGFFAFFLRPRQHLSPPTGAFPPAASLATETPDVFQENFYRPLFAWTRRALLSGRRFQQGRLQLYILYIALTLLLLMVWKLA
jgi:formate hydrogenlyase subunit 3/multisubunit Na+/H+ antiporter MnhD subunit